MDVIVVIPTLNRAEQLRGLLSTLGALEVPSGIDWEVVVVDNGSTDRTRQTIADYTEQLPLRYLFERRQGASHARRRGVLETSSDLIAFVDDDNLLTPSWLVEALRFFREHPRAGAVGARVRLSWEVPPDELLLRYRICLAEQDLGDLTLQMPATGFTYLAGEGLVVRRSALEASGWIEKGALACRRGRALTSGGDSEMVLRIRNAGYELWYTPAMEQQHRIPKERMTLSHLCGLHRGFGRNQAVLDGLTYHLPATPSHRLGELARSGWSLSQTAARTSRHILSNRGRIDPDERLSLYRSLGRVEGAFVALWRGYVL